MEFYGVKLAMGQESRKDKRKQQAATGEAESADTESDEKSFTGGAAVPGGDNTGHKLPPGHTLTGGVATGGGGGLPGYTR